jgi:sRNA-binding protein
MGSRRKHYISKEDYKIILADMQEEYPGLFPKKEVKLFKIGIIKELIANNNKYPATKLRGFVKLYCNQKAYQKLHIVGATRYGLDGKACGEITAEQVSSIQEFQKIQAAKKEAMKLAAEAKPKAKYEMLGLKLGLKK